MVSLKELLGSHKIEDLPEHHGDNLIELLKRVNVVREAWSKPFTITSGYRSMDEHLRIYKDKGITDPAKIPMKSKHLYGHACDVSDPNLELTAWLKGPVGSKVLESAGLYCEQGNRNWVHFQDVPPASGNRWFLP